MRCNPPPHKKVFYFLKPDTVTSNIFKIANAPKQCNEPSKLLQLHENIGQFQILSNAIY